MDENNLYHSTDDDTLYKLAELFKVFGDPTRIRILHSLLNQELCVQDIADTLSMTQSAISHQLRILKQMSLVKFRRDGKTIYYSLADEHVATIMGQGLEHVCEE
ncbi:MAG: winged helix-turn-helix transcriptional regulator [Lachnospiraceae bacterium]|jgi:DNA-binding transcriptional ArsR family regulator|nr:winged helix-turn-helix transcriptional regulator [Lachnospiraceae bacterium]MCI9357561.1 winged helix-turn-helix transcriptional regulator [Lachnospiraceae bacterium]